MELDTADVACKAAEHIQLCTSIRTAVSDAQTNTQVAIDTNSRDVARAQQVILENNRLSTEMAAKAKAHDEEAEGNNVVCVIIAKCQLVS